MIKMITNIWIDIIGMLIKKKLAINAAKVCEFPQGIFRKSVLQKLEQLY